MEEIKVLKLTQSQEGYIKTMVEFKKTIFNIDYELDEEDNTKWSNVDITSFQGDEITQVGDTLAIINPEKWKGIPFPLIQEMVHSVFNYAKEQLALE